MKEYIVRFTDDTEQEKEEPEHFEKLYETDDEIVRCKECKYWRQLYADKPFYASIGCCDCDDMWRSFERENAKINYIRSTSGFYCEYAKRR